jgi:hypothetical protein
MGCNWSGDRLGGGGRRWEGVQRGLGEGAMAKRAGADGGLVRMATTSDTTSIK